MTDEELIARLLMPGGVDDETCIAAADRIEELVKERDHLRKGKDVMSDGWKISDDARISAEAKLDAAAKAFDLIKARAMSTRGDQAYREFPRFAASVARTAIAIIKATVK